MQARNLMIVAGVFFATASQAQVGQALPNSGAEPTEAEVRSFVDRAKPAERLREAPPPSTSGPVQETGSPPQAVGGSPPRIK